MEIQGLAAIVTGGASGLGGGTAELLAARGARVTLFDLNADLGQARASAIGGHYVQVDVTDEQAVAAALAEAEARHGTARILVNCAGVATAGKAIDRSGGPLPLAAFSKVVAINLTGTFNVLSKFAAAVHAAPPLTADGERAVIVNTASAAAFDGQVGQVAYAASKGGVVAMTLPLAREFARYGIRVNVIAPGIFATPMITAMPQDVQNSLATQIPFPSRLGRPEDYARLVEAIVTNPMLNGECIRLDGAIRMAPK